MKKKYILKKNHDIEKLVRKRVSVGNKNYLIYYEKGIDTKVCISISKKLGKAYIRNYQKRILKEILRKNFSLLVGYHFIIVIKKNSMDLPFQEKEKEIEKLLLRMRNTIK